MGRIDDERIALLAAPDLDAALLAGSRLPGPRANLELVQAAADVGVEADFRRWLATDPAAEGPFEFLPVCALVGYGRFAAEGREDAVDVLREWASDPRWRVREAVAMGLQRLGDADLGRLLAVVRAWGTGSAFERRAAVAALAEPRLLGEPRAVAVLLDLLDDCTAAIAGLRAAGDGGVQALRKALAYAWSVAVAAAPEPGRPRMERWLRSTADDRDVAWIMRQNLRKARLSRADQDWVRRWRELTDRAGSPRAG
jgi:HEAT repeat protein